MRSPAWIALACACAVGCSAPAEEPTEDTSEAATAADADVQAALAQLRGLNDQTRVEGVTGILEEPIPSNDASHGDWLVFTHQKPLGIYAVSKKAQVFVQMRGAPTCLKTQSNNDCKSAVATLVDEGSDGEAYRQFSADMDRAAELRARLKGQSLRLQSNLESEATKHGVLCTSMEGAGQLSMSAGFFKQVTQTAVVATPPGEAVGLWRAIWRQAKGEVRNLLKGAKDVVNPRVRGLTSGRLIVGGAVLLLAKFVVCSDPDEVEQDFPELADPSLLQGKP